MKFKQKTNCKKLVTCHPGQALVALLVFVTMATVITAGAVAVAIINTQGAGKYAIGQEALQVAESGADNAILRLLRNPSYTGETVIIGDGQAQITVSGTSTKTIVSEGQVGDFRRKIQVIGTYQNNTFAITSWNLID